MITVLVWREAVLWIDFLCESSVFVAFLLFFYKAKSIRPWVSQIDNVDCNVQSRYSNACVGQFQVEVYVE